MDPRRILPLLLAVTACAVVVTAGLVVRDRRAPESPVAAPTAAAPAGRAAGEEQSLARAVLAAWDRRRAAAWETGDVLALARLYAPGSRAGRADVRMLRAYLRRGLTVEGLRTQVLALRVPTATGRRLALQVKDQASQSFAAMFELRGTAESGELTLTSPLGGTLAVLAWAPGSATLRSNGRTRSFPSVEALVTQATGAAIPSS